MQPKTLWDQIIGHMSIQSQLSRASQSKTVTLKPFSIVAAPQFTEQRKQLCARVSLLCLPPVSNWDPLKSSLSHNTLR